MVGSRRILVRLLERHGRTYAAQMGVAIERGRAPELFRLLVGALLLSARIDSDIAVAAARALASRGYTTPAKMGAASWQDRVDALGEGRYVRYDESTSTYLGETATLLLERYDGDLRRLREEADGDTAHLQELLRECKGIGQVGADIFCREVQTVWRELQPFADGIALATADGLGLPSSARGLAELHGDDDLALVTAALVRAHRAKDLEVLREGRDAPPTDTQLAGLTVEGLRQLARERDIPGRSTMTRDDLVSSLRG